MNKEDNFKEKFKEKLVKENFEYNSVSNKEFLNIKELKKIISKKLELY